MLYRAKSGDSKDWGMYKCLQVLRQTDFEILIRFYMKGEQSKLPGIPPFGGNAAANVAEKLRKEANEKQEIVRFAKQIVTGLYAVRHRWSNNSHSLNDYLGVPAL